MAVLLDENRLEAALQYVACSSVATVEGLGVDTVEVLHPAREVRVWRLDQKVVVIRHQTICMTNPPETHDDLREDSEEAGPIRVAQVDVLSRIPTASHVIERTFILDAKWTCHDESILHSMAKMEI